MLFTITILVATITSGGSAVHLENPGRLVPVTIRPATRRPVFVAESFQPRANLTICSLYPEKAETDEPELDCLTVFHNAYEYVDLEQIEPLLEDQRVLCDENAKMHERTDVVLRFIGRDALLLAKSVWKTGEDLIFVVEDPHCFHPNGDRSFYLSHSIDWNETETIASIKATPLFAHASVTNSGWADKLVRGMTHVPEGYFPHTRPSSGWESRPDPAYFRKYDQAPHLKRDGALPYVTALGCVAGFLGFAGIPSCVIGAPLYGVMAEILEADEKSPHLAVGAVLGFVQPALSLPLLAIGTLVLPTYLKWHKHWDYDWGNAQFMFPWMIPKTPQVADHLRLPHVTFRCPNCHILGDFSAGLMVKFDLDGDGHKGPKECVNSEDELHKHPKRWPWSNRRLDHEVYMEVLRLATHARRAQDIAEIQKRSFEKEHLDPIVKRGLDEEYLNLEKQRKMLSANHEKHFKRSTCNINDPTFPACNLEEVTRYHAKCDGYLDNLLLHPTKIVAEAFKCIFDSMGGHEECWQRFHTEADYFTGFGDYLVKFLQRRLEEAKFMLDVKKKIDINIQPQIEFDVTLGTWFDIDLGWDSFVDKRPPVMSWGFVVQMGQHNQIFNGGKDANAMNTHLSTYPNPDFAKGNEHGPYGPNNPAPPNVPERLPVTGWGSQTNHGVGKMTWGIPVIRLEIVRVAHFAANFTLPGFSLEMEPGQLLIDLTKQNGEMVVSTVPINLKYKGMAIELGKDPFIQFTASLGLAFDWQMIPEALLNPTKSWGKEHGYIPTPFAFGGAYELVRFDFKVGPASAAHPECREVYGDAWNRDGWMMGIYFRHGARLYASFFGARIDTSWVGKLQRDTTFAIDGFYWSARLALVCIMQDSQPGIPTQISDELNKALRVLETPIRTAFQKVEAFLNQNVLPKGSILPLDDEFLLGPRGEDDNAKWLGWESFVNRHGLRRNKDTEVYTPDVLPEGQAACRAGELPANLLGYHKQNCSQPESPKTYNNLTLMQDATKGQGDEAEAVLMCARFNIGCEKLHLNGA